MTTQIATGSAQAMCNALVDLLDAGSGSGTLKLYTGTRPATADTALSGNTLLGTLTFSKPAFSSTSTLGVATASPIVQDSSADSDGVATWARLQDSTGANVMDISVGQAGSGAELILASTSITEGNPIVVTSFTVTMPFVYNPPETFQAFVAPPDVVTEFASDRFAITLSQVGTQEVDSFVYKSTNNNPVSQLTLDHQQVANHFTKFRTDDPVIVKVRRLDGQNISTCDIKPSELNLTAEISGDTATFTLPGPNFVSVEIDETYTRSGSWTGVGGTITKKIPKHPVFILAAPLEDDVPDPSEVDYWYEPGIHEIGIGNELPNGTHIYLEGWAVLRGNFIAAQSDPSNIKVHGNGVVTAKGLTDDYVGQWRNQAFDFTTVTTGSGTSNGTNNEISGITITDPLRSCIVSYNQTDISWLSMFSWQHTQDGITLGANSSQTGQVFIKTQDDQCKMYFPGQNYEHLIVWQQTSGSPCKFGWNLSREVSNCTVEKITMLYSHVFTDYDSFEIDRPEWRSTSAFFSCMGIKPGGSIDGIVYNEIVIEEESLMRLMGIRFQSYHLDKYWGEPSEGDVFFGLRINKLTMPNAPLKQSFLYANGIELVNDTTPVSPETPIAANIKKIWMQDFTIGGSQILGDPNLPSQIDGNGLIKQTNGAGGVFNVILTDDLSAL